MWAIWGRFGWIGRVILPWEGGMVEGFNKTAGRVWCERAGSLGFIRVGAVGIRIWKTPPRFPNFLGGEDKLSPARTDFSHTRVAAGKRFP